MTSAPPLDPACLIGKVRIEDESLIFDSWLKKNLTALGFSPGVMNFPSEMETETELSFDENSVINPMSSPAYSTNKKLSDWFEYS